MKAPSTPLCIAIGLLLASPLAAAQQSADDEFLKLHFGGYTDITYANTRGEGEDAALTLAPILHLQVGERILVESELEMEIDGNGATQTGFEYATVNFLLGDNAALVVGKFLSPTGFFFPNAHPSWINKMPSTPAGFGHGGAATLSDVGVQLRGGKAFQAGQKINYAAYLGNGPTLGLEGMDDFDLDAGGSTHNPDGERVIGGRFGWLPRAGVEIGASLARGDVKLVGGPVDVSLEPSRSYSVDGVDGQWRVNKVLELRGEWIRQRIGAASASALPEGATFRAWYTQGTYRLGADRWEAVARYGQSRSPHAEATYDQFALGINRLLSSHSQLKLAWEFNTGKGANPVADRLLLQIAYGF